MSRKLKEKQEPSKNLLSNYAVALNEKNKLEVDNAMLKLENQEKSSKINKLTAALEICKTKLVQNDASISQLKMALKTLSEDRLKEKDSYEKQIELLTGNESSMKIEMNELKDDLGAFKDHLNKAADNLETYKVKSKNYKEKFKSVVEILNSFAQSRGSLCDRGCQTMQRTQKKISYTRVEAQFDHHILSELFFRDNPLNEPLI